MGMEYYGRYRKGAGKGSRYAVDRFRSVRRFSRPRYESRYVSRPRYSRNFQRVLDRGWSSYRGRKGFGKGRKGFGRKGFGKGRKGFGKGRGKGPSLASLDAEIEEYMGPEAAKSRLDSELDSYFKAEAIAA